MRLVNNLDVAFWITCSFPTVLADNSRYNLLLTHGMEQRLCSIQCVTKIRHLRMLIQLENQSKPGLEYTEISVLIFRGSVVTSNKDCYSLLFYDQKYLSLSGISIAYFTWSLIDVTCLFRTRMRLASSDLD